MNWLLIITSIIFSFIADAMQKISLGEIEEIAYKIEEIKNKSLFVKTAELKRIQKKIASGETITRLPSNTKLMTFHNTGTSFLVREKEMAEGGGGKIYPAYNLKDLSLVLAKMPKYDHTSKIVLHCEIERMRELDILLDAGISESVGPVLIMEYTGVSLDRILNFSMTNILKYTICSRIYIAVDEIHKKGYIHRDIKLSNIVLSIVDYHIVRLVLIDHGCTCPIGTPAAELIGTEIFQPAEMFSPARPAYSEQTDLFAASMASADLLGAGSLTLAYECESKCEHDKLPYECKPCAYDHFVRSCPHLQQFRDGSHHDKFFTRLTEVIFWCCKTDPKDRPEPGDIADIISDFIEYEKEIMPEPVEELVGLDDVQLDLPKVYPKWPKRLGSSSGLLGIKFSPTKAVRVSSKTL
jgi:serine/threonine protein kinase